jgi:hypothetical protein
VVCTVEARLASSVIFESCRGFSFPRAQINRYSSRFGTKKNPFAGFNGVRYHKTYMGSFLSSDLDIVCLFCYLRDNNNSRVQYSPSFLPSPASSTLSGRPLFLLRIWHLGGADFHVRTAASTDHSRFNQLTEKLLRFLYFWPWRSLTYFTLA